MKRPSLWPKFTEVCRAVIFGAQQEAVALNGGEVNPGHLLLGLLHQEQSEACQVLRDCGLTLDAARAALAPQVAVEGQVTEPNLSPAARQALQHSATEANRFGHNFIGPEHLLLALIERRDEPLQSLLQARNADAQEVARRIIADLGGEKPAIAVKHHAALWKRSPLLLNAVCFLFPFASWGPLFLTAARIPSKALPQNPLTTILMASAGLAPFIAALVVIGLLLGSKSQKAKDAGMWLIGGIIAFCLLGRFFIG